MTMKITKTRNTVMPMAANPPGIPARAARRSPGSGAASGGVEYVPASRSSMLPSSPEAATRKRADRPHGGRKIVRGTERVGRYVPGMWRIPLIGIVLVALFAPVPSGATGAAPARGLAFARGGDIWLARADGTRPVNLTRTPRANEYTPAFSPDGDRIAFVGYRHGNGEIYVMNADGTGLKRLTSHKGEDLTPAWSPDGRRIAFASNRAGEFEIFVMNADGRAVRRLTRIAKGPYGSYSPAWSPDGRTLVFSSAARTPENPELYSIRADGTGLKRLTRTKGDAEVLGDDGMPTFSPDGRTIAFTSNRTGNGELWVMRRDGSGQRRLAGLRDRDDWAPRYSPDGSTIVYESLREAASDVWVVRANGTGAKLLLRNASGAVYRP